MSSGYSLIDRPLARKNERQHNSDDDDDYHVSRSNKKRRLSEYLEREPEDEDPSSRCDLQGESSAGAGKQQLPSSKPYHQDRYFESK
jgi:hypothetical protein